MEKIQQLKRNKQHFYVIFERTDKKKNDFFEVEKKTTQKRSEWRDIKNYPQKKEKKILDILFNLDVWKTKKILSTDKDLSESIYHVLVDFVQYVKRTFIFFLKLLFCIFFFSILSTREQTKKQQHSNLDIQNQQACYANNWFMCGQFVRDVTFWPFAKEKRKRFIWLFTSIIFEFHEIAYKFSHLNGLLAKWACVCMLVH